MRRRSFLQRLVSTMALPVAVGPARAFARFPFLPAGIDAAILAREGVLVIIQLVGGNDGLNTLVPVDDDLYYRLRPRLAIGKQDALPLDGEPLLRMHPSLGGLRQMYNEGNLAIAGNIGYDDYSMSHFNGTEIWNRGLNEGEGAAIGGWIGRYLQQEFPDYPATLPGYPPAVQIGIVASSLFGIRSGSIGTAIADPDTFYRIASGGPAPLDEPWDDTPAGREWEFIRQVDVQAVEFASAIHEAAARGTNEAEYPAGDLAAALAIVARLIAGGLGTSVYLVSLGGFDTHAGQADVHPYLLRQLNDAVAAFTGDLALLGLGDRVVGMTCSEFGRRPAEADSGTDHGSAAPHFVFGSRINGGRIFGGHPDLMHLDDNGNLPHTIDFRCYYASVLGPLFQIDADRMATILPRVPCGGDALVPFYGVATAIREKEREGRSAAIDCLPNPAAGATLVRYNNPLPGLIRISIVSLGGGNELMLLERHQEAGHHELLLDLTRFPQGTYLCRLDVEGTHAVIPLTVLR